MATKTRHAALGSRHDKGDGVEIDIEGVQSEASDSDYSPSSYEIVTYPADFTLEVLVQKLKDKEIHVTHFQRQYVWTQKQASKLIESFLLGLPVPPIFLYAEPDEKMLVVDGQQRLRSVAYFFEGWFGQATNGSRQEFRL